MFIGSEREIYKKNRIRYNDLTNKVNTMKKKNVCQNELKKKI